MKNKKVIFLAVAIFSSLAFFNEVRASGNCFDSKGYCAEGCDVNDDEYGEEGYIDCVAPKNYCCKKDAAVSTPETLKCENCHENTSGAIEFANPVGTKSLLGLVGNIMNGLRSVIVVVAIVMIVIGGIMYMSSAGSEKMIDKAKAIIGGALIGLAITLAAPTFLKEIITILGNASNGDPNEVVSRALSVKDIAEKVLRFLLSISGILAIIGLVVGGVFYFTSYGDEERIEKGKEIIQASLIGIFVTLAAVLLVRQIMNLMGVDSSSSKKTTTVMSIDGSGVRSEVTPEELEKIREDFRNVKLGESE